MMSSSASITTQGLDFVPPFRFAMVEEGVYRGAYPVLRNFPFLKKLGIRTILSVTPEEPTFDLREFCRCEKIHIKYIQAERHKGDPQLLSTDLNEALHAVISLDLHPIYIHCLDGRHVIGLVVMALRKLLQWDFTSMQLEYERFARENNNETAYISDYGGGLTVPLKVPNWLWNGSIVDHDGKPRKHPTLKLKFAAPITSTNISSTPSASSTVPVSASSAEKKPPKPSLSVGAMMGASPTPSDPMNVSPIEKNSAAHTPSASSKLSEKHAETSPPNVLSSPTAGNSSLAFVDVSNLDPIVVDFRCVASCGEGCLCPQVPASCDVQMWSLRVGLCSDVATHGHEGHHHHVHPILGVTPSMSSAAKKVKRSSSFH